MELGGRKCLQCAAKLADYTATRDIVPLAQVALREPSAPLVLTAQAGAAPQLPPSFIFHLPSSNANTQLSDSAQLSGAAQSDAQLIIIETETER